MSQPQQTTNDKLTGRWFSCIYCREKKLKCHQERPCLHCKKIGIECIPRVPPAPKRRRKAPSAEQDLRTKIKHYEKVIAENGLPLDVPEYGGEFDDDDATAVDASHSSSRQSPIPTGLSNSALVKSNKSLSVKVRDSSNTCDSALVLATDAQSLSSEIQLPPAAHIFVLWQTFLDNVDPMTKMLHTPTVQRKMIQATSGLEPLPKSTIALLFPIFLSALISMSNADCDRLLQTSKAELLTKYQIAARQALVVASFMDSSELEVMQGFVLFLRCLPLDYNPDGFWALTGIAMRKCQRLRIHDESFLRSLTPFEADIRRRLWFQLVLLEIRSTHHSEEPFQAELLAPELPSNSNDVDLNVHMRETPRGQYGPTEMLFCLIRYDSFKFLLGPNGKSKQLHDPTVSKWEKDKIVDELEALLQRKYLNGCDFSVPLHLAASLVARSFAAKTRLSIHHPRHDLNHGAQFMPEEWQLLFISSINMVECDLLAQSNSSLQRYRWHIHAYLPYFQLDAFVLMLGELSRRTEGELVERAWGRVQEVYQHHPELTSDMENPSFIAIRNLTLKAWTKREGLMRRTRTFSTVPAYIAKLQSQSTVLGSFITENNTLPVNEESKAVMGPVFTAAPSNTFDALPLKPFATQEPILDGYFNDLDPVSIDWAYWDALLENATLMPLGNEFLKFDHSG